MAETVHVGGHSLVKRPAVPVVVVVPADSGVVEPVPREVSKPLEIPPKDLHVDSKPRRGKK